MITDAKKNLPIFLHCSVQFYVLFFELLVPAVFQKLKIQHYKIRIDKPNSKKLTTPTIFSRTKK